VGEGFRFSVFLSLVLQSRHAKPSLEALGRRGRGKDKRERE